VCEFSYVDFKHNPDVIVDLATQIEQWGRALTVMEFADLVHVCEKTIRRHIRAGKFPAYRIGSQVRIDPSQAADWLRSRLR
jgi:excisionase family DNA binding protein